jgi:hypothetical protein
MNDKPVGQETIEAELRRLLDDLRGAPPEVVQAETERLRALAQQIQDERDRERALFRAGSLPRLLAGPAVPTSEQFHAAQVLLGRALAGTGSARSRIAEIEQIIDQIGALANEAPPGEAGAIRRTTAPLLRLLDNLSAG